MAMEAPRSSSIAWQYYCHAGVICRFDETNFEIRSYITGQWTQKADSALVAVVLTGKGRISEEKATELFQKFSHEQ